MSGPLAAVPVLFLPLYFLVTTLYVAHIFKHRPVPARIAPTSCRPSNLTSVTSRLHARLDLGQLCLLQVTRLPKVFGPSAGKSPLSITPRTMGCYMSVHRRSRSKDTRWRRAVGAVLASHVLGGKKNRRECSMLAGYQRRYTKIE